MIFSIDGSDLLPKSFEFFQSNAYFCDLVLAIEDGESHFPEEDPDTTIVSQIIPDAESSRISTLTQPDEVSAHSGAFVDPESLNEISLNSTRLSNLREGSSLHESSQSTASNLTGMANSTLETNENISDGPPITFWKRSCHKVLIAQHSAFFRDILIKAWNEIEKKPIEDGAEIFDELYRAKMEKDEERRFLRVELKDIKVSSLETILNYIYSGQLQLDEKNFGFLLDDAKKMGFNSVAQLCEKHVTQSVNITNWDNLLLCSHYSQNERIVTDCFQFIEKQLSQNRNVSTMMKLMERLTYPILLKLMTSGMVHELNVEAMVEAIIIWIDAEKESRLSHLHSLLEPKIHLLSFEFLFSFGKFKTVKSDDPTFKLVMNTLLNKQAPSAISALPPQNPPPLLPPRPPPVHPPRQVIGASTKTTKATESPHYQQESASTASKKINIENTWEASEPDVEAVTSDAYDDEMLLVLARMEMEGKEGLQVFDPIKNTWSEWKTSKNMEGVEKGMEAQVVGNILVCMGGFWESGKKVTFYDFLFDRWISGPDMNFPRACFASCVTNKNQVLVFGGFESESLDCSRACEMLTLSREVLDSSTAKWEILPCMPEERCEFSAVSVKSQVFVIGGRKEIGGTVQSTAYMFELTSRKWTQVRSMNKPRRDFAIATNQDVIYVFGGWNGCHQLLSAERYNPNLNTWVYIANLLSPLSCCTAGVLGNGIFIIGGKEENGPFTKNTHVYHLNMDVWTKGAQLTNDAIRPKCVKVKKSLIDQSRSKTGTISFETI